jgi:hypothetical protein
MRRVHFSSPTLLIISTFTDNRRHLIAIRDFILPRKTAGCSSLGENVKKMEKANKKGFLQSTKMFVLFSERVSKNKSSYVTPNVHGCTVRTERKPPEKKTVANEKKGSMKMRRIISFAQNTRGIAHKTKV